MKILLVDNDESLSKMIAKSLANHHYVVDTVKDGETGWTYGSTFDYDLIVLDMMLPKLDGISLCKRFRAEGCTTPILLLTAKDTSTAKVSGLDAGADDCVVKPFDVAELGARIRALLRRSRSNPLPLLSWGDLLLNSSTCEVTYNDRRLTLTTKEYELLELLLQDSQHVFSTDEILGRLWSSDEFPSEATVRSHIRRVRHKLLLAGAPSDCIATVHGRGYYLKAPEGDRSLLDTSPRSHSATDLQAQYLTFLNETWAADKPKLLVQLTVFASAIAAIQLDSLDSQLCEQARHTAHKLAGTLGIFGLHQGMALARQLEQAFSSQDGWQSYQAVSIAALVQQLRQEIQYTESIQSRQIAGAAQSLEVPLIRCEAEAETKVMVVDEDQNWLRSLPQLLSPWNFKLTTLADPHQFWTVLQAVVPDVLVLDVNLPETNGFELCQALRRDPHWQRLPVLFLSVLSDRVTQNQAFTVGADDYLCKPVVGIDLANRILNRLQRVRACQT
ncbi:MAG: response regulator [Tildeniella nuda ZEHNDER 1965/U140]|jgi:DNA-binding response OmpR family regulator/HPt (histidine-containing phosphotransfer) domain-containing protein|nr:response regulator [Tildeniella nuda ZEHNDER 1965/U140]